MLEQIRNGDLPVTGLSQARCGFDGGKGISSEIEDVAGERHLVHAENVLPDIGDKLLHGGGGRGDSRRFLQRRR
jgi:hypothetical protein